MSEDSTNIPSKKSHKLSPKEKIILCSLLAQGLPCTMVAQELKEEFGVEITPRVIWECYANSRKWKPFIQKLKSKYYNEVLKHPLADKTARLSILLKAIKSVMADKSTSNSMGTVASLIKEARAEIEGDASSNPIIHQKIVIVNSNNEQSGQANRFISKLTRATETVSE